MTLTDHHTHYNRIKSPIPPMEYKPLKVCVVNDAEVFREGLKSLVDKIPNIESVDGFPFLTNETWSALKQYDLIITEIESKHGIDVEFIKQLKENNKKSKIVVYTHFKNARYQRYANEHGADFFVFIEDKYNILQHLIGLVANVKLRKY